MPQEHRKAPAWSPQLLSAMVLLIAAVVVLLSFGLSAKSFLSDIANSHWTASSRSLLPVLNGGALLLVFGLCAWLVWSLLKQIKPFSSAGGRPSHLASMVNKADLAVVVTDPEGSTEWVNEGFARMSGFAANEIVGRPPAGVLIGPLQNVKTLQRIRDAIGQRKSFSVELLCTHKRGHRYWLSLNFTPVLDEEGALANYVAVGTDITARKRTEEELQRVSHRNELILQAAGDGICGLDPGGHITFVNEAAARLTGWHPDELTGKPISTILHRLSVHRVQGQNDDTFAGAALVDGTVLMGDSDEFRGKDGRPFPVEYTSTPLREGEKTVGSVVVFRNIAERKQSEALRARQSRQAALRADVAFGSTAKDDVRIFLGRVSQALVKHLDGAFARVWTLNRLDNMLELQASAGLYAHIDGHHSRIPMGTLKVGKTAQSGVPCLCQDVLNDPDVIDKDWVRREQLRAFIGYPLFVEHRLIGIMALYARQPLPEDAIETCSAIADFVSQGIVRRLARDTIAEQAALLDEAQDAIVVFDLLDRCTYWNRSAERLYGWEAGEALGQPPHALILRDKAYFERAKALTQQEGKWIDESEQTTRDGRTLTVESRWTLIHDEKGQPKSILIVNTDVTEKRRVESQFLRTQRMEGIGTLAGGIAHDLNNVLAPILMSVQMLKEKFKDPQSQRMLAILESSAQRGAGMVKQVLTFARGMDGERVLLQAKHLVKEVAKIVAETFPKTIEVRSHIDEALWATMGDSTQLHQVLLNLAVNARDAMPDGGSITFTAENTVVEPGQAQLPDGVQPGYYIVIKVTDNGTGIPPEILDKIFEPFFTTKEVGKGTGLGLSTVVGIVKSHGGFVQVQTELNRGTSFLIYLPAQEGAGANAGAGPAVEAASLPAGNGELLLLVDDEPALLTMTREMLEANGYRVVTASDGTEAVAAYTNRSDEVKLVITDMLMPQMDGPTTIRVLRKLNPALRFIAVSGQMDAERAKEATNTESLLYLMKPYTAEKLLFMVQKGLQSSPPATVAAA